MVDKIFDDHNSQPEAFPELRIMFSINAKAFLSLAPEVTNHKNRTYIILQKFQMKYRGSV